MKGILLFALLFCSAAKAENVDIYGVPFKVDALEQIDSRLFKLTLSGRSELVSSSEIKGRIVHAAISDGSLKEISYGSLKKVVLGAARAGDLVISSRILNFLLDKPGIDQNELLELLREISEDRHGAEVLRETDTLLGRAHPLIMRHFRIHNLRARASDLEEALDIAGLRNLLSETDGDQYLNKIVEPYIIRAFHSKTLTLLNEKNPQEALLTLSKLPFDKRTPTTHNLMLQSLEQLSQAPGVTLEDTVVSIIEALAAKDPAISAAYSKLLQNRSTRSSILQKWLGLIIIISGFFLALILVIFLKRAQKNLQKRSQLSQTSLYDSAINGEHSLSALELSDFNSCLALLGLSQNATAKEIKAAFRAAVKKLHPDSQKTPQNKNSDQFIKLTQAYERLLELLKQKGRLS